MCNIRYIHRSIVEICVLNKLNNNTLPGFVEKNVCKVQKNIKAYIHEILPISKKLNKVRINS